MAIDGAKPMFVGSVTAQLFHCAHQTDVGTQGKESTPTGAGNMPKVSDEEQQPTTAAGQAPMTWAQRLKRVFTNSRRFRRI
jgi:hypothetical protein